MFKKLIPKLILFAGMIAFIPTTAYAASNAEVSHYANDTLTALIILASISTVFFLVRGGYLYITSTGNPTTLEEAKKTIRQAIIGLVIVVGASVISSILNHAMSAPNTDAVGTAINLGPIQPAEKDGSLSQILLDAISGFLQNIIQSVTKPIIDGVTWFLTSTPSLSTNSVIFNFWLIIVGITDSLFAVVIALLGFRVMSASSFGFEELSLKELLPRIALAFVMANTSIFLIDWLVSLCQTLVQAVLNATGGIGQAWILNAFDPAALVSGTTALITLIFMVLFVVLSIVLLLFYISRLMILAFGAVISPLVCLLWLIPRFTDFAENAINVYLVTIYSIFVHVVIIQLASAFLTVPGQVGANPIISVLIGIAMLSILLKSTATGVQLALSAQSTGAIKKVATQIINVVSSTNSSNTSVKQVRPSARTK
ncbi:MAG: hypothetical protein WCP93_02390 [Candidatus Berkelbacteria bacterium]